MSCGLAVASSNKSLAQSNKSPSPTDLRLACAPAPRSRRASNMFYSDFSYVEMMVGVAILLVVVGIAIRVVLRTLD